jgi:hypothetical protein
MFNEYFFAPYFTPEAHIDSFQATKRGLTNKIITDPILNKAANDFIDAQAIFAKMLANNFINITKSSVDAYTQYVFPKKEVTKAKVTKAESSAA